MLIEGLKITIGGEELASLCKKQVAHHRERSSAYAQQIASLEVNKIEGMQYSNGDPTKAMQDKKAEHDTAADELDFIGSHLVASDSYHLEINDLRKIGIIKSGRGYF